MGQAKTIVWLRNDLRLRDNPALVKACKNSSVYLVYIYEPDKDQNHHLGAASKWWLHYALKNLNKDTDKKLNIYQGSPQKLIPELVNDLGVKQVFWNRCYEPHRIEQDIKIKKSLKDKGVEVESFNGSLLWEPWEVLKSDRSPYKVFTPYYRNGCLALSPPRKPIAKPCQPKFIKNQKSLKVEDLNLLPKINWHTSMDQIWDVSEKGAHKQLKLFLEKALKTYKKDRDFPAKQNTSQLSPYLRFGMISVHQVWHKAIASEASKKWSEDLDCFLSELGWREFSYYLLYHFKKLPEKNFQIKFDKFPWTWNQRALRKWQKGQTGIPIVDAGMRELWQTGYMHNRVRMIVGSFLVKNLLIHWHKGRDWFWDCLVDADLANNSSGWQWIAGSGADAAPYFRIFNPVTQAQRFDPQGTYIKKYVPELQGLSGKDLWQPWQASEDALKQANLVLGKTYPKPMVDLKESRKKALDAFASIKKR